ncbi:MAG: nitroreductase family protein, partial [Eubacteriales bacterium]|nr:nitroreductase family protein [Eubacteriales bacterium]
IALGMCDTSLFQPLMGMLMKFENVQRFAAIILKDDQPKSVVNAGISGEMFLLRAVELGLGGCWVSGTYKRGQVGLHLADGEKILALIALGRPKTVPVPPIHRKRKEVETLCVNFATLPSAFKEAALYVRSAPSAMNRQPWRMRPDGEKKLILSVSLSVQRVDLGIALCHALLALGSTPAQFTLDDDALSTTIELL